MKRAVALWNALIAPCSIILMLLCCGCGQEAAAPLLLEHHDCPSPSLPALPELDGEEPLDSPENVSRLLERDDRLRGYIDGLNAALRCEQARRPAPAQSAPGGRIEKVNHGN